MSNLPKPRITRPIGALILDEARTIASLERETDQQKGFASSNGDDWWGLAAIKAEYEALLEKERLADQLESGGISAEEFIRRWRVADGRIKEAMELHQAAGAQR